METSQQKSEQHQNGHKSIALSTIQEEDEEYDEEMEVGVERETTANIPIVRGNTPRFRSFHTMLAALGEPDVESDGEQIKGVAIPPFPSRPPSAPPVPEAERRFDVIEKSRLPHSMQSLQEEQIEQMVLTEDGRVSKNRVDRPSQKRSIQVSASSTDEETVHSVLQGTASSRSTRLIGFAIYLLCLLLLVLTLAVVQGIGVVSDVLTPNVALLGVPWMVLVYGLLAGCVSCLVTLGRYQHINPPVFVLITWYARPFAAVVLALFAYLMLNSGLLLAEGGMARHQGFALVVGAIAGLCEGWLFLRRSERISKALY